jgi:tetratricopeptide (TPR) repeat protein
LADCLRDEVARLAGLTDSEKSRLQHIRRELDFRRLADDDIAWLGHLIERRRGPDYLFAVLARFWEARSEQSGDAGKLTRAAGYWRRVGQPNLAISCLEGTDSIAEERLQAIVSTIRAASFIDMEDLKSALPEVERALRLDPDHPHTYRVMARICRQLSELEECASYFALATARDTSSETRDEIRRMLETMTPPEKQELAKHLLAKGLDV